MANNPYVNKVVKADGTTIIDISDTTAVAADVASGKYFYLATGEKIPGTATGGGGGDTRTTIVPEQTGNYTERYNQINFVAPLVVGEVYVYTIDGVASQGMAFDNYGSVAIGSPETTIGFEYANSIMYLSIADSSLRGTHTIKVEQESSGGGGSSATLITKTITQNGTYDAEDDSADGYSSVTVNVPSGASNIVTGTFKGTTTGAAMDVDLAYTGNGYPLNVIIYPKEGAYDANSTIYTLLQRYCTIWYAAIKDYVSTAPDYNGTGTDDQYTTINRYKNNATNYTTYGQNVTVNNPIANGSNALASSSGKYVVAFKAKNKMSVFIANTSYGFPANIEFKYQIVYSS